MIVHWSPQWSLPSNGGSTGQPWTASPEAAGAAMEPAVERREHQREHQHVTPHCRARIPATMEAVVERWEHVFQQVIFTYADQQQWSPPLNGGSTKRLYTSAGESQAPQWSPPLNSGERS